MYNLLVLSSASEGGADSLYPQLDYIKNFGISIKLCIDPTEIELLKIVGTSCFDSAYVHIKRRAFGVGEKEYDPVKILEQKGVPLLGNKYITQLFIADKYTTSRNSGIGLPGHLVSRLTFEHNLFAWDKVSCYPVIVKPNTLHASMGITEDSVVRDEASLKKAVENLFVEFPFLNEVLIEKFSTEGQEYTVSVLGNGGSLICSVSKLNYKEDVSLRINSKSQKELPLSDRSFVLTVENDEKIRQRLEFHAKVLFNHFGMKDIARFDFILDKTYYLLEANTSPIPGNSFTWEWQERFGLAKDQVVALYLSAFHFAEVASGRASRLPLSLIESLPNEIISKINQPEAVDVYPECSGPTDNCYRPHLYSMGDRVSSETEVHTFLKALTFLLKPEYILETGTYKGHSTMAFAEGLRQNNFGSITTLEIDEILASRAKILFSEYPVEVLNQNSLSFIPTRKIDLLFLDSKRDIRRDEFAHFRQYLNDRAIIVWHDSSYREQNHSVYDIIEELYEHGVIDRILFPTPRGLTVSSIREV